ncbi:hypothetical protein BDY17DRAFT_291596 [Neohortaea acidophila]|uniref:Uncharacterized protein n=1 Tax=Neohortaea acidophila TaxID=245834 RepID=A0A6A6Q2G4_9PEZI|nr:uncharacterized protein BDY17DRAFT_291596 [Neohortaea acidophila]KAF2486495.1 hypothetical protein BDY17DRAFT_291596 [Neohortaea acidophila]
MSARQQRSCEFVQTLITRRTTGLPTRQQPHPYKYSPSHTHQPLNQTPIPPPQHSTMSTAEPNDTPRTQPPPSLSIRLHLRGGATDANVQ